MSHGQHYGGKLNRASNNPIYYQIYQLIRSDIESGYYEPNESMPSENVFRMIFDVSKVTIRRALSMLESEQYIKRERGSGTIVLNYKETFYYTKLVSFTRDLNTNQEQVSSEIISFDDLIPPVKVRNLLGLNEGERVYRLVRIRKVNNLKLAYSCSYITKRMGIKLSESMFDETASLFNILRLGGLEIGGCDETLEAQIPNEEIREYLDMTHDMPVFYRERITYNNQNVPFEFVTSYYNANYYRYYSKSTMAQRELE